MVVAAMIRIMSKTGSIILYRILLSNHSPIDIYKRSTRYLQFGPFLDLMQRNRQSLPSISGNAYSIDFCLPNNRFPAMKT